jgi:CheY-like chemotaxis protein
METTLRLLVIDDEQMMLSLFEMVMAEHGYVVATANSGRQGLEIARAGQFDVVVSDIKMPDMTGIEVLAAIRAESADVGVVLITGYASIDTAVEALRLGADAYLLKPFEDLERDVLGPIQRVAQKHRLRRENERLTAELHETNERLTRTNHEYRRTLAHLTTQQQMASMLTGARDVKSIAAIVDQALVGGFDTHACALLLSQGDGRFELIGGSGLAAGPGRSVSVQAGSGPLGIALDQPRPTQLDLRAPQAGGREAWMPPETAALVVPCMAAGAAAAALVIFEPDPDTLFAPETVSLYSMLAAQIAAPLALAQRGGAGALAS